MAFLNVTLTRDQSRNVDELATEELKIPSIILMENAGRSAAEFILGRYKDALIGRRDNRATVQIVCGTGNNGGDGLVIARHLHNAGCQVRIWIAGDRTRLTRDASVNLQIVLSMGLPMFDVVDKAAVGAVCKKFSPEDVIVDAMLGTGFFGDVREPMASLIGCINALNSDRVVAVDVPSGLDCDAGTVGNAAIRANATVTFVAIKRGFEFPSAREFLGEVAVGSIGTPPSLIREIAMEQASER